MSNTFLKKLAKQTDKSLEDLERYWKETKDQVGDNYKLITAIVKRRARGFVESDLTAEEYIDEKINN